MKIDSFMDKEKSPEKAVTACDSTSGALSSKLDNMEKLLPNVGETLLLKTSSNVELISEQTTYFIDKVRNATKSFDSSQRITKTTQNGTMLEKVHKKLNESKKKELKKRKLFLCSECNQHFNLKSRLFQHFLEIHKKFTCLFCCGLFIDGQSLEKHLIKKHDVQKSIFFDEKTLKYSLSSNMPVDSEYKVLQLVCCECGKLLNLKSSIEEHPCKGDSKTDNSHPFDTLSKLEENDVNENHSSQSHFHRHTTIQQQSSERSYQIEKGSLTKLVPKITLRIPRAFQHRPVESEEDSDDELSSSDESKEYAGFPKSNDSSWSDRGDAEMNQTPVLPSLKLKIKNLGSSNPESFLENLPELMESQQINKNVEINSSENIEDLVKKDESMEKIDEDQDKTDKLVQENDEMRIFIDGLSLLPAGDDVMIMKLPLDVKLADMSIISLLKACLKSSFPYCLYCNHARKIVVNGKALACHFISSHRFNVIVNGEENSEVYLETFVHKVQKNIKELECAYFNLDTYDNTNNEMIEGHVTISHDKLYECFQCRFQTPIHKELYLHNRKMHQKSLISCLMCKTPFYSYSELLCHICPGIPHKQTYIDYKFYCCLCNLNEIPSAFRLMIHLRKKHFACDVCLEKCSDQAKLSSHVWKHKLFHLCYRCNICYRSKADIMKHLFWKHGTEGIECRKCLQKKWPHVYHFCTPPSEFKCNQCEKVFSKAIALKIHLRIHEEDGAKYECTEITCDKKFIARKLLIRHLERHKLEKMSESDQKVVYKSTIIVPLEIPDGCCTRSLPVVFNRLNMKAPLSKVKIHEVQKVDEPLTEVLKNTDNTVDNTKKSIELPKSELNLSESSDSDSDSDSSCEREDKETRGKASIEFLAARLEAELYDEQDIRLGENVQEISSLSNPENTVVQIENETKSTAKEFETSEKNVNLNSTVLQTYEKIKTHVCQSDHDYAELCFVGDYRNIDEYSSKRIIPVLKNSSENPFAEFSSSSSSDSSSSSNTSSSTSSSSATSSDTMSSSEASPVTNLNDKKKRNKKFTKKRQKKIRGENEISEEPRDPDLLIYESDLVTNESDTDEDFYDEHPLKLDSSLAEKRKLLSKGDIFDGIVENSRPSTPSLPPEERISKKPKKKKKKESKKNNKISKMGTARNLKSQEANEIRFLLQKQQSLAAFSNTEFISVSQVPSKASSATSSRMNSDSENPPNIKRSQRKRVPNKFYGYTDGDESSALQSNDPFRPIPPPQLTWRKEDLPEKNRNQNVPKVAPIKLNISNDNLQQQLHSFALEHGSRFHPTEMLNGSKIPYSQSNEKTSFGIEIQQKSSGENSSLTPVPKRIQNQEKSIYVFHTLEAPAEERKPLKFKLKFNSKVNPLKRKLQVPKSCSSKSQKIDHSRTSDKLRKSLNLQNFLIKKNGTNIKPRSIDSLEKKQKLEEAIQNTQQYFQRFNCTQVSNNELPAKSTDERVYCYCRRAYDDLQGMIGCDGHNCQIEWFHFECVGILVAPIGKWFCPECMKEQSLDMTKS